MSESPTEPRLSRQSLLGALAAATSRAGEAKPADEPADVRRRPGREIWIAGLTLHGNQAGSREEALDGTVAISARSASARSAQRTLALR